MSLKFKLLLSLFAGFAAIMVSAFTAGKPSGNSGSYTIKGQLSGTEGTFIYLYEYFGTEIFPLDSVGHSAGKFTFSRKQPFDRGFYKIGSSIEKSFPLILSKESIEIRGDLNDLESIRITGSRENELYKQFTDLNNAVTAYYEEINRTASAYSSLRETNPEEFNRKIAGLQKKLDSAVHVKNLESAKLMSSAKGLFAGKFIRMFSFTDTTSKETFFSPGDFSDPELVRGDMLPSKISLYMQRYIPKDVESWKKEAEYLLGMAPAKSPSREIVYQVVIRNLYSFDQDFSRKMAEKYLSEYPDSRSARNLYDIIPKLPPAPGEPAREIVLATPEGKPLALSSLKGKVVLLDFWASWCGPCRRENPNVVKAYSKFRDKGFTVFSVSLDDNKDRWIKAIKADSLIWENHVSDLKGWQSSVVRQYGIKGIPSTFLVDPDGKVIAVNLRGEALDRKLEEIFK